MYIIIKWWRGIPQTRQLATQERYATHEEAERVAYALASQCYNRKFAVIDVSGLKETHPRTDEVT
jgi:hypothetical protein